MTLPIENKKVNEVDHNADIGIIGHGETIENCFANVAHVMFSLMLDVSQVHLTQIITFEFVEADSELALATWLNLLITKSQQHQLMFGDFRLKKENNTWHATVSGERWRDNIEHGIEVKGVTSTLLSVKKINHLWEARCVVNI